jgi:hypothetical protein
VAGAARRGLLRGAPAVGASFLLALGPVAAAQPVRSGRAVTSARALGPRGPGPVHFGTPKAKAVRDLVSLFGEPSSSGINTGCGPRYSEAEWGEVVAEFRSGSFRATGT